MTWWLPLSPVLTQLRHCSQPGDDTTVRVKFNRGPTKTTIIMPGLGAADTSLRHLQCTSYKLLGFHLDSQLVQERKQYLSNIIEYSMPFSLSY